MRPGDRPAGKPGLAHERPREVRKQLVLTQGKSAITQSIAHAIVIKHDELFFLSEPDGSVPLHGGHGFGLYYHDCRYLDGYEARLAGAPLRLLTSASPEGFKAIYEFTNPDLQLAEGRALPIEQLGITCERVLDCMDLLLIERYTVSNYSLEPVTVPLELTFKAGFEDVFDIRGMLDERLGASREPTWQKKALRFEYDGADGLRRSLEIRFSRPPDRAEETRASFDLTLEPKGTVDLEIYMGVSEVPEEAPTPRPHSLRPLDQVEGRLRSSAEAWVEHTTTIRSGSRMLNHVLDRSLHDLRTLRSNFKGQTYFAAGVPWFVTLFGRDSVITALQTLAFEPCIAEETLRILCHYQGQHVDEWRDEEPGKILHEHRIGEFARTGLIPHSPYYGTVDATPLFLILMARYVAWTGNLSLFEELGEHVDRALGWIERYADSDGDGYVDYTSDVPNGLIQKGWKDSGDAIVNADGRLCQPPIALVEVQAYVYRAKLELADLFDRTGSVRRADRLRQEAVELRERFEREFWLEDLGFYALALQKDKRPAAVISSNPGHALWMEAVDPARARLVVERLMADDMFSGWGIRTLSQKERAYNPIGYHLGTVWPHDNAILAAGFRAYGFDREASQVFSGILEASMHFEAFRLPELFSGYDRAKFSLPVHYPLACHPQAWAAGTIPYFLQIMLGLHPEGLENRLLVVRPILPDLIDHLSVTGLRVGKGRADLAFVRTEEGIAAEVLRTEGDLEIVVKP